MNRGLKTLLTFVMCVIMIFTVMPAQIYTYADETGGAAVASGDAAEAADDGTFLSEEKDAAKGEPKEAVRDAEEEQKEAVPAREEEQKETAAPAAEGKQEEKQEKEQGVLPQTPLKAGLLAAAPRLTITIHLMAMGADGEYTDIRQLSRTVNEGGSTSNLTLSIANNSVSNKTVVVGDDTYTFTNTWKLEDGSAVTFPYSLTYEEAAALTDGGTTGDVYLYANYRKKRPDIKVTVHFVDIRHANGTITEAERSSTIGDGGSWSINKTTLESTTGLRTGQPFSYAGYRYEYTGEWTDEEGNTVDVSSTSKRIRFYNKEGETSGNEYYLDEDTELTLKPVYTKTMIQGLDYQYIDRVSTGSGSWSNADAFEYRSEFGSLTHTYKEPDGVQHYRFEHWFDTSDNRKYYPGDSFTYTVDSGLPEGTVTNVKVYAMWQPSVTIRYHTPEGVSEKEGFEDLDVYDEDFEPAGTGDIHFAGWYDSEGNRLPEDKTYSAPNITGAADEVTEPAVYDVYARFTTSHTVRKEWDDQNDKDGLRKQAVTVKLLANGEETSKEAVLSESGSWSSVFSGLDAYDSDYELIEYTVEETTDLGDDYTTEVTQETDEASGAVTSVVTNTLIPKITIKAADDSKVYDGKELTNADVEIVSGSLFDGDELVASATGSARNVADTREGNNVINDGDYKIMRGDVDVTDRYSITREPGTLTVTPAPLTIRTSGATKKYDGKPLTSADHEITGLAEGDSVTVTTTGSQTDVGTSRNTYTISWDNAIEGNYIVSDELGDLTVTEATAADRDDDTDADTDEDGTDTEKKSSDGSPRTGDDGHGILPALLLMIGSAGALAALLAGRKRKEQE